MREAKRNLKEKGIKAEDVKHLPPIEDLCKPTPPPSVKVNSLQYFNAGDGGQVYQMDRGETDSEGGWPFGYCLSERNHLEILMATSWLTPRGRL